jgi:hypothetical protein
MSEGFDVRLLGPGTTILSGAHVDRFEQGVERACQFLEGSGALGDVEFALSVSSSGRGSDSPTLNLERKPGIGVLAQVFASESWSPSGEEGWYNLMEPRYHDQFGDQDVTTIWERGDREDMVETRLSQGVLFSRRMFVPLEMALDALRSYLQSGEPGRALEHRSWKFVGLI